MRPDAELSSLNAILKPQGTEALRDALLSCHLILLPNIHRAKGIYFAASANATTLAESDSGLMLQYRSTSFGRTSSR